MKAMKTQIVALVCHACRVSHATASSRGAPPFLLFDGCCGAAGILHCWGCGWFGWIGGLIPVVIVHNPKHRNVGGVGIYVHRPPARRGTIQSSLLGVGVVRLYCCTAGSVGGSVG